MKKRRVWPVRGLFIQGVPHVPHECEDPFCTESGAFTTDPPPKQADDQQPETPPDGGVSDSED